MKKRVIVLLADGFEDVEATTPIDYLRRAGAEVVVAGVGGLELTGARGMRVKADASLADLSGDSAHSGRFAWDAVVVPGGMPGAANIAASVLCSSLLKAAASAECVIAAICAAPAVVLAPLGLLTRRRFTCYPGMESKVSGAIFFEDRVVVDGKLITSRAAGTAGEWAVTIIAALYDRETADRIAQSVLLKV